MQQYDYVLEDNTNLSNEEKADLIVNELNAKYYSILDDRDRNVLVRESIQAIRKLDYELYTTPNGFMYDFKFKDDELNLHFNNLNGKNVVDTDKLPPVVNEIKEKTLTFLYSAEFKNGYKMVAGTLLPAFVLGTLFISAKNKAFMYTAFILGLIAGGYYTSKILNK